MSLVQQIRDRVLQLPPEKQSEVLEFVLRLQRQLEASSTTAKQDSLREHPAFGSWRERKIDSLQFEQSLRSEWDR
jgi:hypothetical protein